MTAIQEKRIRNFLDKNPNVTKTSIAKGTDIWLSTACHIIDIMEARGEVEVHRVTSRVHLVSLIKK